MSFIPMSGLKEAKLESEKEVVGEGTYNLQINNAIVNKKETGVVCFIGIDGHPGAKDIIYNINFPQPGDDETKVEWKLRFAKAFLGLFGAEFSDDGFDLEQLPGLRAFDVPVLQTVDDKDVPRNEIAIMQYI